jgi:YidC/Oxa1 family membrane protein insertase
MFLYAALGFIIYSLFTAWQFEHQPKQIPAQTQTLATQPQSQQTVNMIENSSETISHETKLINIKTDVISLDIDLNNGNIVQASLLKYPQSTTDKNPFELLTNITNKRYIAESNLYRQTNQGPQLESIQYDSTQTHYVLSDSDNTVSVMLNGKTKDGLNVTKTYILKRDNYLVNVELSLKDDNQHDWSGYLNTSLLRTAPEEDKSSIFHIGSYTGASYGHPGVHRYQKVSFKDMEKKPLSEMVTGGWIAMQQHYFLTAWIPEKSTNNLYYSNIVNNDYVIGSVSQNIKIDSDKPSQLSASIYLGPENTAVLSQIAPGLDMTVDYGMLWFISALLFSIMKAIHSVVGNWGWSIVLVTVLIKLVFFRLSASSYRSMAGMRKIQPKLQALKEKFGDDKQQLSQETMRLYREAKVNPLGGCLPILIQIPFFIALYWVLIESVELRQAPFIAWIHDLAAADPLHILPVIMGITMLVQQKLNPPPPDPTQAKMMMLLPVLFTGLFWGFPAGLVLYWIVNNTLSIAQQWVITRRYQEK